MKYLYQFILLSFLVFPQTGIASDTAEPMVIYITASRVPESSVDTAASIRVIDRKEITSSGATSVNDVLRGKHGVHIYDLYGDGSRATIDMRGFGTRAGSNVLVMLDGRRLNPSTDAPNLFLNDIPLDQVERIEVVHGSSGVLFGNQAVGGVINIISRKPQAGTDVGLSLSAGSLGQHAQQLTVSQKDESGLGLRVQARNSESKGYRDNNDSEVQNLNFLADYQKGASRIFFEQRYLNEFVENPGALFLSELAADRQQSFTNYRDDFTETVSNVSRIGFEHHLNAQWKLFVDSAYRQDDVSFRLSSRWGRRAKIDTQDREIITFNPRAHARLPMESGDLRITVGSDLEYSDYFIDALFRQSAEQLISAVYAQAVYPFRDNLDVSLGVRHARVDNDIIDTSVGLTQLDLDDDVTVASLGVTYRPDNHWRWFARADQNYRFAKLEEHTADTCASVFPNPPCGLNNQKGLSLETGFEYNSNQRFVALQFYHLRLDDELSFNASNNANINIDSTERNGLNFSITEYLTDTIDLGLDLDLTRGKITAGPHTESTIPMVPEYQARVFAKWQLTPEWMLGGNLLHVSEQVLDSDYQNAFNKLDDYTVVNANAQYRYQNWTLDMRINNLFDHEYSEFGTVGSAGSAGIGSGYGQCQAGAFADDCPAFTPSPERTFWVGLKVNFYDY